MNDVGEVFSFTGHVRFFGVRFSGRKDGICRKCVRNVGTSSTVFAATERARRKWGLEELEEILAVTSKGPDALGKFLFILRKNLSPVALDKCAR